jgi:hypothetical protein
LVLGELDHLPWLARGVAQSSCAPSVGVAQSISQGALAIGHLHFGGARSFCAFAGTVRA